MVLSESKSHKSHEFQFLLNELKPPSGGAFNSLWTDGSQCEKLKRRHKSQTEQRAPLEVRNHHIMESREAVEGSSPWTEEEFHWLIRELKLQIMYRNKRHCVSQWYDVIHYTHYKTPLLGRHCYRNCEKSQWCGPVWTESYPIWTVRFEKESD